MDLTPKQQTSEAIRQAENILITTGQHPSVDQVVSVLAMAAILRKFGKKVSAIISDPLPQPAQFLDTAGLDKGLSGLRDFVLKLDVTKAEVDKLRYEVQDGKLNIYITPFKGGFAPSDVTFDYGAFQYDLMIVLGVPARNRIDRVYSEHQDKFSSVPLANVDFHRSNENYGAVNLIEPTASSLCEILVALSESLQTGLIDADIATTMLAGLMASTDRFTASHTTSKSLTVAAQLMAAGARQQQVVKGLFRDGRGERDRDGRSETPRQDRGERDGRASSGGRSRDGERPTSERPREEQPRSAAASPASRPMTQPTPAAAAPAPQASAATPQVAQPAPAPIIQPDHIELSRPEAPTKAPAAPATAPAAAQREPQAGPAQPAASAAEAPALAYEVPSIGAAPIFEQPAVTPAQPTAPAASIPASAQPAAPMADFAAAAELLRERQELHDHARRAENLLDDDQA